MAELDPCTTLDLATATKVLGDPAQDGLLTSLYGCSWTSSMDPGPVLGVSFTLGSDPRTDDSDGTPKPVQVAGITAYQVANNNSTAPGCDIRWAARTQPNGHSTESTPDGDQIVDVGFVGPGTNAAAACAKAAMAAAVVVGSLPKK